MTNNNFIEVINFDDDKDVTYSEKYKNEDEYLNEMVEQAEITSIDWWGSGKSSKQLKTKEDYKDNLDLYQTYPLLFSGVNMRADFSVGVGFEIQCSNLDIKNHIRKEFRNLGLTYWDDNVSEMLFNIPKRKDLFGNEYWEKIREGKKIVKLIPINAQRLTPNLDKKGNIVSYEYRIPGKHESPDNTETILLENIIHFKSDTVEDSAIGMSKVHPCKNEAKAVREVSRIAIILIKTYIKPWLHFKYEEKRGTSAKGVGRQLKRLVNYLQDHKHQTDFVTSDRWTLESIKSPFQMSEIKEFTIMMDAKVLMSLQIPDSFYLSYGSTDLKVGLQMESFKRVMRSMQSHIGHVLIDQLIVPMVRDEFGLDMDTMEEEDIPKLVWNKIIEKDIIDFARAATSLYDKGVLSQDEARKLIGFEAAEIDLEDILKDDIDDDSDEDEINDDNTDNKDNPDNKSDDESDNDE